GRWETTMDSSDDNHERPFDAADERVRGVLRSLPLPPTPAALEARVRGRVRRRRVRRTACVTTAVLLLAAGLLMWRPWRTDLPHVPSGSTSPRPVAQAPPREIPLEELEVLFA